MSDKPSRRDKWLAAIGDDISDAERAEALTVILYRHVADQQKAGQEIPLPDEGLELLRQYAKDRSADVRAVAIDYMTSHGPCLWNDLEEWAQDGDRIVRETAISRMENAESAAGRLCESDKAHCAELLETVGKRFGDYQIGHTLRWLSEREDEWFDLTWAAVDSLIDQGEPELSEMVVSCYLEQVVPERKLGVDDPHLRSWITGDSIAKKRILLRIANYWGIDEGCLGDIVEALLSDPNTAVATIAEGVREGRIEPGALWLIGDVGADEQMAEEEYADEDDIED